jgi:hypothetical protein
VAAIREAVDVVEVEIMAAVSDEELAEAGKVLVKIKATLMTLIGSEAEGAGEME